MIDRLNALIDERTDAWIATRRDFHRHAEPGWCEFRTASLIARRLDALGYAVRAGREVMVAEERMGLPPEEVLEAHWQRARAQGADREYVERMRGGFPALVATLRAGEGPVIGMRFDIDALEIPESNASNHRPAREGFASVNEGVLHACGHDAHGAIGLGVAEVLASLRHALRGTFVLIFQPAEEGVRGAKSMVAAGVVDEVDYLLCQHVHTGSAVGEVVCGMAGSAATQKFDVTITGAPSHAGGSPQNGKNALQAAAAAVLNLYALPRHGGGFTRVNVGRLTAGTARNVIAPSAHLVVETRGESTELSEYMYRGAVRVIKAAAAMYDCTAEIVAMGGAESARSDPELDARAAEVIASIKGCTVLESLPSGGSEDYTYMMRRVQERGGQATHFGIGADLFGVRREDEDREAVLGHHTTVFDIDEAAIPLAVRVMSRVALSLLE